MADQPSPRRRLQFRLRTLFVLMTVVAVQCAICLPALKEWQDHKRLRMGAALVQYMGGAQGYRLRATQP